MVSFLENCILCCDAACHGASSGPWVCAPWPRSLAAHRAPWPRPSGTPGRALAALPGPGRGAPAYFFVFSRDRTINRMGVPVKPKFLRS